MNGIWQIDIDVSNITFISFQNINVAAFKPLVNLRWINIPNVKRELVFSLCNTLTSLDTLRFTADNRDVTCFVLIAGDSFEDSVIRRGQTTLSDVDNESGGN